MLRLLEDDPPFGLRETLLELKNLSCAQVWRRRIDEPNAEVQRPFRFAIQERG